MELDAEDEPGGLDGLSLILPLPYRLSFLFVLGVFLWGANLHGLRLLKIDVPHLIRYPPRSSQAQLPHYQSVYRFALILYLPLFFSLVWFWWLTAGDTISVVSAELIPNLYLLLLVLAFVVPTQHLPRAGRSRFLSTLRRISIGGLANTNDGKFADVLLADALTSYAKPLSEVYIALCMLVNGRSTTWRPERHCGGAYAVPIIMSIPFLIRFRQCITDRQPANALKYATAFPAIALSAMQRDIEVPGLSHESVHKLWILCAMTNSLYSFYWDVTRDWDLTLFTHARSNPEHPFGLRRQRVFDSAFFYYLVILIDLLLRCLWSLKLSVHFEHFYDIEGGMFFLEIFEICRRWMWVFLRVEAESIRARNSGDVRLDDLGPKIDED